MRGCPKKLQEWKLPDVTIGSYDTIEITPVDKKGQITIHGPKRKWTCLVPYYQDQFVYYADGGEGRTYVCVIHKQSASGNIYKLQGDKVLWTRPLWGLYPGLYSINGGTVDNFSFQLIVDGPRIAAFFDNYDGASVEIFEECGTSVLKFSSLEWHANLPDAE